MKTKIVVLFISLMACQFYLRGQDALSLSTIPTPNASTLGLYDKIPVNHFTGSPNISVPIYQATYRDLKLPIELSYHPASIKPDQQVGWVGYGWNLMAGGVITRERRGYEDEHTTYGYFKKHSVLDVTDWSTTSKLKAYANSTDDKFADIFRFNMNGYSGEIIMTHTGTWVAICDQSIKVVFDQINDIMTINGRKMIKRFTLVTSDGTKYTFGGSLDFVEFSYDRVDSPNLVAVASSWYLSKIESSATKAAIQFSYERGTGGGFLEGELICSLGKGGIRQRGVSSSDGPLGSGCSGWGFNYNIVSFELQSPLYLKEITYSDFKIKFYRSVSNALQYSLSDITSQLSALGADVPNDPVDVRPFQSEPERIKNSKLDSLAIWRNDVYVKSFSLEYNNGNIVSTQRLALTQVKEKGLNNEFNSPFQFFYYNLSSLPGFNSHKVDHWGFYNNSYAPPSSIESQFYSTDRDPSAQYTTYGVLNKIIYPTKGMVEFDWESHDYGASVPIIRTQPLIAHSPKQIAGGPRVKKITFTDPINNSIIEKNLYYVKGYTSTSNPQTLPSSGVLAGQNEYRWTGFQALNYNGSNYATLTYDYQSTSNQIPLYTYLVGSHVAYSEVVEVTGSGNGYTIFKFTNFDNGHGDDPFVNTLNITGSAYFSYSSKSIERGKLVGEYIYNSSDGPVKSTEFEYSDPTGAAPYLRFIDIDYKSVCPGASITLATAYKKYHYKYLPVKKTERVYKSSSNKIETQTFYTYNNYSQLIEERANYLSKGEIMTKKIKYCTDFNLTDCSQQLIDCRDFCTENSEDRDELAICVDECDVELENCEDNMDNSPTVKPLLVMRDNFMISLPVELSEYINKTGTNKIVKAEFTLYKYNSSTQLVTLGSQYKLELDANATSTFTESTINTPQQVLQKDSKYSLSSTFNVFDSYGNLNEVTGRDGITSVQLWGYDYRFPLIQVSNSTYSAVNTALGANAAILTSPQVSDNDVRLIAAQLRASLPNAEVKAFTYNASTGLTSQVDISGKVRFYEYDNLGRLKIVRDNDGNILNQYEYNYQN